MSTLKVDAIRHNNATSDAITTASDGTCTARITGMTGGGGLSHRNLIINGAFLVAQRGTSSTSDTYATVDRFYKFHNGIDANVTQAQADVASGTTPYSLGFRKSFKITNGNQTNGANADDVIEILTRLEAQDIANSGWNYTSSSSFITLSFWVKSSVAQNFFGHIQTQDGTAQNYPFETGSLTADTWTKVTKTIPGNSNLQFDNNNDRGLIIKWQMFRGTNTTDPGVTLNAWAPFASGTRTPPQTSTWYTTNSATWEITGVQLEVGDIATSFEHRKFGDVLRDCSRYYQTVPNALFIIRGSDSISYSNAPLQSSFILPEKMRSNPTGSNYTDGGSLITVTYYSASYGSDTNYEAYITSGISNGTVRFYLSHKASDNGGTTLSTTYKWGQSIDPIAFDAEL